MTQAQQPAALHYAGILENYYFGIGRMDATGAAAELRQQHARIAELEADIAHKDSYAEQLGRELTKADAEIRLHKQQEAAIGAGGVEPLRSRQCLHKIAEPPASQRDELLQAALDFIGILTGMTPPPIEVAPPEVFAPFYAFVDRVQAITRPSSADEGGSNADQA